MLALGWTVAIGVACLVQLSGLPNVPVENADKGVHFIMHFGFAFLWLMHLQGSSFKPLSMVMMVLIASLVYGSVIEWAQQEFTANRMADARDVLANSLGALAASVVWLAGKPKKNK